MGEPGRREDPPVSKQLLEEPWRFGFFQGTRLLEWIAARARRSKSAGARFRNTDASVGGDLPAGQEAVRFRATASPRFPADEVLAILPPTDVVRNAGASEPSHSQIAKLTRSTEAASGPPEMIVGFFGLTGPWGCFRPTSTG